MSGVGGGRGAPSKWAVERFGRHAGRLAAVVPEALARAHARAHAAHLKARVKKRSPYGSTLAEAVRENLTDAALEVGEAVRDVRGYEYAVVNECLLFPYKYANRSRPLARARLAADASPTRRRLLLAHGPQPDGELFPLGEEQKPEKYEELHETFEELGAATRLVCLFFTANAEDGIHAIHWGDARLEPNRTFTWLHGEQLPVAPPCVE
ncbi:hypothetical protein OG422_16060 [Streptomyces sp. NBC_01525]|uniref:hypothetical protein n=1 Tax=Streptomyces sp. NBC_01525 TaxID=2903893 RepID=UPI0038696B60